MAAEATQLRHESATPGGGGPLAQEHDKSLPSFCFKNSLKKGAGHMCYRYVLLREFMF